MSQWDLEKVTDKLIDIAVEKGPGIVLALLVLIIGFRVITVLSKPIARAIERATDDPSLTVFLTRIIRVVLRVLILLTVASMIGIETTSLLTLVGAMGLAIGLALQGSLSNFAGGVVLLVFKPFKVDDYIETEGEKGTVERLDVFHTTLRTFDNKVVIIPNGKVANAAIVNYTRKDTRRVDFSVGISYQSNVGKARQLVLEIFKNDPRTLADPEPIVVLTNFGESSLDLSARAWVKTPEVWQFYWDNIEKIKASFDEHGIEIPFPQRDIHIIDAQKKLHEGRPLINK